MNGIANQSMNRWGQPAGSLAARLMTSPAMEAKTRELLKLRAGGSTFEASVRAGDWSNVKKWLEYYESQDINPWDIEMDVVHGKTGTSSARNALDVAFRANDLDLFVEMLHWAWKRGDAMVEPCVCLMINCIEHGSAEDPQRKRAEVIYAKLMSGAPRSLHEANLMLERIQEMRGTRSFQIAERALAEARARMELESFKTVKSRNKSKCAPKSAKRTRL